MTNKGTAMNITIVIDGELSQADKDILLALAGGAPAAPAGTMPPIGQGEPERKKPGPKPKAKPEAPKEAEKPVEAEAPKEAESDAIEKAVARAAELLQSGEVKRVKSVLEELGAARVSSLKPAQVPEFLEKLA